MKVGGATMQVHMKKGGFYVAKACEGFAMTSSPTVRWSHHPDATTAWEFAKLVAGVANARLD